MENNNSEKYNPNVFIARLQERLANNAMPTCRFCGGTEYYSGPQYVPMIATDVFDKVALKESIPAGAVVCKKCGHVELFALGALDLLPKRNASVIEKVEENDHAKA